MNRYALQIAMTSGKEYTFYVTADTARDAVERFNRGLLHRIDGDVVIGVSIPVDASEWEEQE